MIKISEKLAFKKNPSYSFQMGSIRSIFDAQFVYGLTCLMMERMESNEMASEEIFLGSKLDLALFQCGE